MKKEWKRSVKIGILGALFGLVFSLMTGTLWVGIIAAILFCLWCYYGISQPKTRVKE